MLFFRSQTILNTPFSPGFDYAHLMEKGCGIYVFFLVGVSDSGVRSRPSAFFPIVIVRAAVDARKSNHPPKISVWESETRITHSRV